MICDRCGEGTIGVTGSYFNTELICFGCRRKEEEHPLFETARRIETEAVKNGDYNYPGIGLPVELIP